MNSDDSNANKLIARGSVEFYWDSGDQEKHLLVNIVPDKKGVQNAYELTGELRDGVIDAIGDGVRIEIEYLLEHHEIVDPDLATTHDGQRARVIAARIIDPD